MSTDYESPDEFIEELVLLIRSSRPAKSLSRDEVGEWYTRVEAAMAFHAQLEEEAREFAQDMKGETSLG